MKGWMEGRREGERKQPPPPPPMQPKPGVFLSAAFLPHSSLCLSSHEHRGTSAGSCCHAAAYPECPLPLNPTVFHHSEAPVPAGSRLESPHGLGHGVCG